VLTGRRRRNAATEHQVQKLRSAGTAHPIALQLGHLILRVLKAAKETHSPAVGDRLLTAVALTLVEQCSGHLLDQWEGSTFAILIEGIDPAAAADMISAASAGSSAREMKVRDNDQHLGRIMLSVGVVARRSHVLGEVLEAAQTQLRRGNEHSHDHAAVGGIVISVSATS